MRRLLWVGVGVAVTVLVVRKGRQLLDTYLPPGTTEAAATVNRWSQALSVARREFAAGSAEREEQLRRDLVGDADIEDIRAHRAEHVAGLRAARPGRHTADRVPRDWAGPTEDPDDDDGYAFF